MRQLLLIILCLASISYGFSQETFKAELVLDTKYDLGEGSLWNYRTQQLYWVNITGKLLNIYDPRTGENREIATGQMIGTVVPSESGKAIVALQEGIYQLDVKTGQQTLIVDPEPDIADNRFNDGKCDPAGRFWAGTISLTGKQKNSALYRIDGNGSSRKMIGQVTNSNGIIWSPDKRRMYYIDTPTRKVMGYDYNNKTGEISNGKVVVAISNGMGGSDGMTIDARGNLWIALWGGSAVGCFNPQTGELIAKVEVPAPNVSSCAFGDSDLGTLYITTARQYMNESALEKYPFAGGLFKVRPGVKGIKANFYKGKY